MTKENWIRHMEQTEGISAPSHFGDFNVWQAACKKHKENNCPECKARQRTYKANQYRKQREQVMLDCGLTKYRHPLTGSVCWE